jgi:hypothetical protein
MERKTNGSALLATRMSKWRHSAADEPLHLFFTYPGEPAEFLWRSHSNKTESGQGFAMPT